MRASVLAPLLALLACGDDRQPPAFEIVVSEVPEAVLSIGGTSARDVWAVGADKGRGPLVLHYDGSAWNKLDAGTTGALWWVHAVAPDQVFFGGENETVLRWDGSRFERLLTPGVARDTVFGIWGESASDVWAVGSVAGGRSGFVWRWDGNGWREVRLPDDVPRDDRGELPGFFKVWGDGKGNVWVVGGQGTVIRFDTDGVGEVIEMELTSPLFTVHGQGSDVVVVGGGAGAALLEEDAAGGFTPFAGISDIPILQGIYVAPGGHAIASGFRGEMLERTGSGWARIDHRLPLEIESLHAAWIDPDDGVWAVGGNVLSSALDAGAIIHRGAPVREDGLDALFEPRPPVVVSCPAKEVDPAPNGSIARRWNEQILGAIRRDLPRPGVHARNLYHLSAAIWDAWAAYDPAAAQLFVDEKLASTDVAADRREAISYASYRVITHRYATAVGGPVSTACFDAFMVALGYDPHDTGGQGTSARALGNRIGAAIIAAAAEDGANEAENYADPAGYAPRNEPLYVDGPGASLDDPNAWQPLNLAISVTQNGIPIDPGAQVYIGSQWGLVVPFAIQRPAPESPYFNVGSAPALEDVLDDLVEVIRRSSELDPTDGAIIDISPGALGNNSLGENDGAGYDVNPATGLAYAEQLVGRGDFGRTLAEFWADGPRSETPPGHWNVLANQVSDAPGFERRLFGAGEPLDPLEWDVKTYIALNGAVHDAAIAAWEIKREFESARPISLVRHLAGLGQRSDPDAPSYDPAGLPLIPELIEVITEESSAQGARHAGLAPFVGQIAIRAWRGEPGDRVQEIGGCDWVRAVEWMPYQRRTFVTPAFPGFVSGHSTFSRAAAEVMTELTGSQFFPGGLGEFVAGPDAYLTFERGPSAEIRLQWATYYDAADQAGQSRIWGGIHVSADDFGGRRIGSQIGLAAVERARQLFDPPAGLRATTR